MSKSKSRSFVSIVVESLGWPLFWGLAATFAFYLLIGWGMIQSAMVSRYFAGHPVEYVETGLFFIATVALLMKAGDLAFQFKGIPNVKLPAARREGDAPSTAGTLLDGLEKLPSRLQQTYLSQRLSNALRYVLRSDSADELDDQLRYLSDVEAERSHEGYSLVRMIVWATPMLGFLGTVIGITVALGSLSPEALVNAPKEAMEGLLAGLSVAFDTTALALSLSIVLMFLQYLVREVETQLLTLVDRRVEDELIGRFQMTSSGTDPHLAVVTRMSQRVIESVDEIAKRQAELWSTALSTTQRQWSDALQETSATAQSNLVDALEQSMKAHAEVVTSAEREASRRLSERWQNVQAGMQQQASILAAQHETITRQGDVMLRVLDATGEVTNLETALNQNLAALAGSKNFEDTVVSLSAAIQLLTARLGVAPREVKLQNAEDRAA